MGQMTGWTRAVLIAVVLLTAIFFRLHLLATIPPGLYFDEAWNGKDALESLRTGSFPAYYPANGGREGLFIATVAGALEVFKQHEPWVLRLPAALYGILTVFGVYLLGKELFSAGVGFLASFLLAISTWHLAASRICGRCIVAPAVLVFAAWLFLVALRGRNGIRWIPTAIAAGVALGLGAYSYTAFRPMPLVFAVCIPFFWRTARFRRVLVVTAVVSLLVASPLLWYFWNHPTDFVRRPAEISVFQSDRPLLSLASNTVRTAGMFLFAGDRNWRHNIAGKPMLFLPVGICFVIGVLWGVRFSLRGADRRERFAYTFLLAWMAIGLVPVVLSNDSIPHALRSLIVTPAVMILAAAGASALAPVLPRHRVFRVLLCAVPLLLALEAYHSFFLVWGTHPATAGWFGARYTRMARAVNAAPPGSEKYVVTDDVHEVTVRFLTGTIDDADRKTKRIHYVAPDQLDLIPPGAAVFRARE